MYKMLIKNEDHLKFQLKQVDSPTGSFILLKRQHIIIYMTFLSTKFTTDYHTLQINYNKHIMF